MEYCKTCKTYIAHSELINRRKAKNIKIGANESEPQNFKIPVVKCRNKIFNVFWLQLTA